MAGHMGALFAFRKRLETKADFELLNTRILLQSLTFNRVGLQNGMEIG